MKLPMPCPFPRPPRASLEEKLCPNKMYCPNKHCSAFINLDKLQGDGQGSSTGVTQAACPGGN